MATFRYPHWTSGAFTVKRHKLSWIGHVCRHDTLLKIILLGTVDGSRRRGRPHKSWKDNMKEWTGQSMSSLLHITDDRGRWSVIAAGASVGVSQRRLGVKSDGLICSHRFSPTLLVVVLMKQCCCFDYFQPGPNYASSSAFQAPSAARLPRPSFDDDDDESEGKFVYASYSIY